MVSGKELYSFIGLAFDNTAANSMFIKLWLEVKLSTLNHYFAFVVN